MTESDLRDMAQRLVANGADLSDYEFKIHPSAVTPFGPDLPTTLLGIPLKIHADCPPDRVFLVRESVRD